MIQHRGTEAQRGFNNVDDAMDPFLQGGKPEVQDQTASQSFQAKVRQHLRFENWMVLGGRLAFHDHLAADKKVDPEREGKNDVLVVDRARNLAFDLQPGLTKFPGESFLIHRLKQPRTTQLPMHLDGALNDPPG